MSSFLSDIESSHTEESSLENGQGGLQNADISNVVRDQVVEAELHLFAAADVVAAQDAVGDGLLAVTGTAHRLPALPADGLIP